MRGAAQNAKWPGAERETEILGDPARLERGVRDMNKARRSELDRIRGQLEQALSDLEAAQAEEEDSRDSTPENLQGTERYEISVAACDSLADAVAGLETAISAISEAVE